MVKKADIRLKEALEDQVGNFLLPFYWQTGDHYEQIPEQIARIHDTGEQAFCVEARPHPDFAGPLWWRDMDQILEEAEKRGMQVWILDDDHFPTGHANGTVGREHPELLPYCIAETHTDVIGPMREATFLLRTLTPEDEILGVYAYQRISGSEEEAICGSPVDLSGRRRGYWLSFDVPAGCWRVFVILKTRAGTSDYIDMMRAESVRLLIDETYEKHWQHYSRYFGTTLAGFFSDEPRISCGIVSEQPRQTGIYERTVGIPDMGFPYSDDMCMMDALQDFTANAPLLWYPHQNAPAVRLAYMDVVTRKYRDNFVRQIGDWCRTHGVKYIGHIIEDMNCHARLGCSAGHYFRTMDGQDMSGIDIVLHQVMPGCAHFDNNASIAGGVADSAFFHYVLGQLAASDAHTDPKKQGRAMCEVFGAYGWAEGNTLQKWLIDFLLVRGINHFVPHAFAPRFPCPDCPPHFGFAAFDPQYEGFCKLMGYTNRMSHLLSGQDVIHHADVAVLYHGEAEWMNNSLSMSANRNLGKYMLTQEVAKALLDEHISYDILCADVLTGRAKIRDGMLAVGEERYHCLILPYAEQLPEPLCRWIASAVRDGLPVFMAVRGRIEDMFPVLSAIPEMKTVSLRELPQCLQDEGFISLCVQGDFSLLRHYHVSRGGADFYFFFNENAAETASVLLSLPEFKNSRYLQIGDMFESVTRGEIHQETNGALPLTLAPYESVLFVFNVDDDTWNVYPESVAYGTPVTLHPHYRISTADYKNITTFVPYRETDTLFNLNAPEEMPEFSGKIRYTFSCNITESGSYSIDFGEAGNAVSLAIDGFDKGFRICRPYRFDLGRLEKGKHTVTATASNTLVGAVKDHFSTFMPIQPAGILGPLILYRGR